jgi:uncharacterized phage protein (TIGR02220 family)/predicted phage replisome organizer
MAGVDWIKITVDMFDNRKIKHLRKLPEGNNIVLIWVMLLTMAGRCNAGGMIFLTENIPYTPKMLADELGFEESTVRLALQALEQMNMIVTDGDMFTVAGWGEYQNIEGLDKIREQNRLRQKKWYDRQKALPEPNVRPNVILTQPNGTDIDKDKDKDIETDKDKEIYKTIISYLNEKAGTKYKPTTAKTKSAINARLAEKFTVDDFKTVIDKKCADWLGTEWEKYLRPETLFGTKFENYLNAKSSKKTYQAPTEDDLDGIF